MRLLQYQNVLSLFTSMVFRQLNDRTASIETNRAGSAYGLKRQAETMLSRSGKRFPPAKVGENVLVKIPDEDRGRTAPRNIMAVIMAESDGLYKLGTSHGLLAKLYARNEFQVAFLHI